METQIIIVAVIVNAIISWLIAEFLGKSRHIGFGWSFALSFISMTIIGLIATLLSPSAKKQPTQGGKGYKVGAWICFVFLILNTIRLSPMSVTFLVLGIYLWELSKGNIINRSPKFYFSKKTIGNPLGNNFSNYSQTSEAKRNYKSKVDFNETSIKDKKAKLKNLFNKGILNESEYRDKIIALEQIELESEIKKSEEYLQLKNLFEDGILSSNEFKTKVSYLKNNFRNHQSNIRSKISYNGFVKAVEIYNISVIQDNKKNLTTLKIRLQGLLNKIDNQNNNKDFVREQLNEYNTLLNEEKKLKIIHEVNRLPTDGTDTNVLERMTLDFANSLENKMIWKTKRDMYATLARGEKEFFPDLKSLLLFIQAN